MKLQIVNLFNYFLAILCLSTEDTMEITVNFALLQKMPTNLNVYFCWARPQIQELQKILAKHLIANSIVTTNNFRVFQPEIHQLFVLDLSCPHTDKIFQNFISSFKWSEHIRVLVFNLSLDLEQYNLKLSNRIFFVQNTANGVEINGFYKISNHLKIDKIYSWSKNEGIIQKYQFFIPRNRSDLEGTVLVRTAVLTNNDSINHLTDYRYPDVDPLTKINWLILNYLAEHLNATIKNIFRTHWGSYNNKTQTFDGLVGDHQQGRAEIGATSLIVRPERAIAIDYTNFAITTRLDFMFIAPPLSYSTNIYTLPFHEHLWYSCFGIIILYLLILYLIVIWEWKDSTFREILIKSKKPMRPFFFEIIICEIGVISQQGTERQPKSISGRISLIVGVLSLMFIYLAYSANIVALLQSHSNSIATLEDLLNSRIALGVDDIVYNRVFFKEQTDPIRKGIYEQKVAPKGKSANFFKTKEGILKMKTEFFAFHVEKLNGYKTVKETLNDHQLCSLRQITFLKIFDPQLSIRRNSQYKEIINVALRKMQENGQKNAEYKRIATGKPHCQSRTNNFVSVGLIDTYFSFLILLIGVFLAFMLLILEISHQKYVKMH